MKIINGRWVNDYGDQLSVLEISQVKELGERVTSVFGDDITYERIEIINALSSKDKTKENIIRLVFNNEELLTKLSGL
jgi:hypothetical protein